MRGGKGEGVNVGRPKILLHPSTDRPTDRPTPSWSLRFVPPSVPEKLISISCINEGNRQRTKEGLAMGMGMGRVERIEKVDVLMVFWDLISSDLIE